METDETAAIPLLSRVKLHDCQRLKVKVILRRLLSSDAPMVTRSQSSAAFRHRFVYLFPLRSVAALARNFATKKDCCVDEQLKVCRLSSIRVREAHVQLRN